MSTICKSAVIGGSLLLHDGVAEGVNCSEVDFDQCSYRSASPSPISLLFQSIALSNASSILLQGPRKSGKTSILMDAAISIASTTACRCSSFNGVCHCLAVTMIVPEAKCRDADFPLSCKKYVEGHIGARPHGWNHQMQQLLQRIQICHVASFRDAVELLFSIQGRPLTEQPLGGILLDDVNLLCSDACTVPSSLQVNAARTTQLLAILIDTAQFLERIHSCRPKTIVTLEIASQSTSGLPCYLESLFPQSVSLVESPTSSMWKSQILQSGESILKSWCVCQSPVPDSRNAQIEYAVCRHIQHGIVRILWHKNVACIEKE